MTKQVLAPDYIFEASWEVCNKVGGIYTVLSTRANTLQKKFTDKIFFIGPDVWKGKSNPLFIESDSLFADWKKHAAEKENLSVRIGRWDIPGRPLAFLVDFQPFYEVKNQVYGQMWEDFKVDSLHAYGDYDEASMFAYATGKLVESFYRYNLSSKSKVVFQAHEWMTGFAALYLQKAVPAIATIFTTHATSIGRSIAGNGKPLYDYLSAYNGDQMAGELNMQSKHSIEKQTAHFADCFTTVSKITDNECSQLLEKASDVILMNGFEDGFVPKGAGYGVRRKKARAALLNVADKLLGEQLPEDTLIVGTSGRYEFKNKGIDVFLESLSRLNNDKDLKKTVLAYINVPGWVAESRADLKERLEAGTAFTTPLEQPCITHWLHDMEHDCVLGMLKQLGMENRPEDKVKVIFVPCYLNGDDGIFNKSYYDLLIGQDLSVYPSYYEPWGYTPLESVAFKIPTITTDLAGFGMWAKELKGWNGIEGGVEVLHRTDYNYSEVADGIRDTLVKFSALTPVKVKKISKNASAVAEQALWKHFIAYYYKAYEIALQKAAERNSNK